MGEIKFWNTPELVTHLLTFLDPTSILNLAHAHRMTVQILQNGSVWTKLIRRTCPFGEEEDWPLQDTIVQRKRGEVRLLVGLMELLEDQESHQLELLELIQKRFPPTYVPFRLGPEETPQSTWATVCHSRLLQPLFLLQPLCLLCITSGLSATGGGGGVPEIGQFPDGPIGGAFDVYSQLKSSQSGGAGELS